MELETITASEEVASISDQKLKLLVQETVNQVSVKQLFITWQQLFDSQQLKNSQMHELFTEIYHEQLLFNGIESNDNNLALKRSLIAFVLARLAQLHLERPWLNLAEATLLSEMALDYMDQESVHVSECQHYSWLQPFANGAELLADVVLFVEFDNERVQRALTVISHIILDIGPFSGGEESRIDNVIVHLVGEDLIDSKELMRWVNDLIANAKKDLSQTFSLSTFLRSLVFKLEYEGLSFKQFNQTVNQFLNEVYQQNNCL
ncbi:hypothetical protein JOC59_001195 [Weissella beninensis]|uniref:DUF2785 domain-containing protein n=1 Tax=Periweissella beninensis TaxID=504936 RepID=A0ABT0VGT1_9LACO|nr:DUF2785 domain-containing protein [Periweissella beninensis]MBM7544478.1 hypothetical protein [Periweissella beninensis]MCM2437046.1 DUF2785 domain-containing protein [Periweissella beninensis]